MKVLIVLNNFKSDGLDGIGNAAFRMIEAFRRFLPHYELTVLYESRLEPYVQEKIIAKNNKIHLIPFNHSRIKIARVLHKNIFPHRISQDEKYNYVVYVAPPVPIFSFFSKAELITILHDVTPIRHARGQSLIFRLYFYLIICVALYISKKILTVSQFTRNDLLYYFPSQSGKISVLYNTIPGESWSREEPEKYFLIVSTIQPGKNIETAIAAFAQFIRNYASDYKLVIVGKYGWGPKSIYTLPLKLGIEGSVEFKGYVSENALGALYSKARCLVNVSVAEGFGLPVLEAMYKGVPSIVSADTALGEVAGSSCIRVSPMSKDEIASAMALMAGDLRQKLSDATRLEIIRFDPEPSFRRIFK